MTLEDFFTLTEMKNGLATLARVEELISKMQQQKDCVMMNVGDAVRQWSTVASTLAATESKDCLEDFVKLDGLHFLNQWLQEALKYSNDIADSTVEELIHALLGSLEKLPVDREQSITSGVNMTIEKLLGFKGVTKERARVLSERWKHAGKEDVIFQETVSGACGDAKPKCSADGEAVDSSNSTCLDFENSNCRERTREGNCGTEPVGTETHNSSVMVSHEAAGVGLDDTSDVHSAAEQTMPSTSSITADANANLGDTNMLVSSCPSNSHQEHISRTDESSVYPAAEVSSRDACDASMLKDDGSAREMNMEVDMKEGSPKFGQRDICTVLPSPSFSAASPAQKPERSVSCNFDFKGNNYHASKTLETLPRSASVDCVAPNILRTMDIKSAVQELHDNGSELKKGDTIETSFHTKEVVESDSEAEELGSASVNKVETLSPRDFSKMGMLDQTSELGFQDGELDALEIARQVAIEVEREVVDYREPFCSSSPEGSSGEVTVEKCKQDEPVKEEVNRSVELLGKSLSGGPSSPNEDNLKSSETDFDPDTCKYETRKQTTKDAYESIIKSHGDRCDFDLNKDLGNEEDTYSANLVLDSSVSVSAPIAVSASKRAPVFPVAPICFEGEQGWKGSAATSAFRPASPRKTDPVKMCAGQKRKSNLIEIDLNVAESGEDDATPVSHGFHSLDDSMEVSSRRADRLKLDLNHRLGDDDAAPDQLSYWRPPLRNSDQTMSPASSSSSRQPSMRDFDLNDNPSFFDAFACHNHKKSSAKAVGMYENSKLDVPAITIMGSRLAVERKDFLNDTRQSFMVAGQSMEPTSVMSSRPMLPYDSRQSFMVAGQSIEPTPVMSSRPMLPYDSRQSFMVAGQSMEPTSVMSSRPMLPYARFPLSTYGYNGPVMGPPMPMAPSVYGPGSFPYIIDSRGTTAVPQIIGGAGGHGGRLPTPSFLMNVPNAPSALGAVGSAQSFLDLNSGLSTKEAGNMDVGTLKHVFMQGHNGLMEKRLH